MDCEWAILCDTAYRTGAGRTNIEGVFDTMKVKPIPGYVHPQLAIVSRITGNANETGTLEAEVYEPGGRPMGKAQALAQLGPFGTLESIVFFSKLPINYAGVYSATIFINGAAKRTVTFTVDKLP